MKRMYFLFLIGLCFGSLRLSAEPLPIENFVKHGDYLDLKLSPDGKHIAARFRASGRVLMAILDTQTMKVVGGIRPENNDIIHTVSWINNERLVFEYAEKQHNLDQPVPTGELYATNFDGTRTEMIYGYRAGDEKTGTRIKTRDDVYASQEILSFLEHDEDNILILEHPWSKSGNTYYDDRKRKPVISVLNVYTGRKKKVERLPHPGAHALATKHGSVNFISWRDQDNNHHAAYRKNKDMPWQDLTSAFGVEGDLNPIGLSEDENHVFFSGQYSEARIHTVYALELGTGKLSRVFADHATDVEGVIYDSESFPAVAITYPGKSDYVYSDKDSKTKKIHQMLVDAFQGQTVDIASRTQDGKTLLIHVSSDINPGEYYLFDRDDYSAKFIWANRSWIDPRTMVGKQPFSFTTEDGVTLNGYITDPYAQQEQKAPLVVLIHGGPHQPGTRDFWLFDTEVQLLANNGYAVLQVNFRGSDGYGQAFVEKGYGEWGGKMIDDIIASTEWVVEQGFADGERVCAYGASYGGYAALMTAIKAPELFDCTVGYAGIYDLSLMFTESDIPDVWGGNAYLQEVLGTDASKLKAFSPAYHVDKLDAEVMLIHGAKDRRTPEINAEVLQERLQEVGKEATFLRYRQSGHGVYDEHSRQDLYQGLLKFLDKNLKDTSSVKQS